MMPIDVAWKRLELMAFGITNSRATLSADFTDEPPNDLRPRDIPGPQKGEYPRDWTINISMNELDAIITAILELRRLVYLLCAKNPT